jgi:membrane protease YdiL (CAAX protease family)
MTFRTNHAGKPIGPEQDNAFVLHALLAYAASVLLLILVGGLLRNHPHLCILAGEVAVAIPAAIVLLMHRKTVRRSQFSIPHARQFFLTALIGGCTAVIAVYLGIVTRKMLLGADPSGGEITGAGLLLLLTIVPPPCEELLFRPLLQNGLTRQWGPRAALLLTAFFFSLYHLRLVSFGETFAIGLFAGIVYLKTGRFWCAVTLHLTCNALGPVLWRNAGHLAPLFHPVVVVALVGMALVGCYGLGEASPVPLRGIWQRLGWAALGTTAPRQAAGTRSRKPALLASIIGACLITTMCYAHIVTVRQLREPRFKSNYVVSEEDEWTVVSPAEIQARSTLVIKESPAAREDLILLLPFPEARLRNVSLGDRELPFSRSEPNEYRVDLSSLQDMAPAGTVVVRWDFLTNCLAPPTENWGYGAPLRSLLPSVSFSLKVTLTEGSGFQFSFDPQARTAQVVNAPSARPRMDYGNWYGLRKKE